MMFRYDGYVETMATTMTLVMLMLMMMMMGIA